MNVLPIHKSQSLAKKEDVYDACPMKIMILDPHTLFRTGLVSLLEDEPDIQISIEDNLASSLTGQISILRPNIIIMGGDLYAAGGRETMLKILSEYPDIAILILAFQESAELMLDAIRNGARGYLPMDFTKSVLVKSLHAMARGEIAISRSMTARMAEEFSRISRGLFDDSFELGSFTVRIDSEIQLKLFISNDTLHINVSHILKKLDL